MRQTASRLIQQPSLQTQKKGYCGSCYRCVGFKQEVLEAIAEVAFKTSDYPLIISCENHLS